MINERDDRLNWLSDFEQLLTIANRIRALLAPAAYIEGIDLNRFRRYDLLDPAAVYASGKKFAILEATWGLGTPESFGEFWPRLLDAGFLLIGYGFFRGDQDGADQADLLLNVVAPMYAAQGFWMPVYADVERFTDDTSTPAVRIPRWRAWNQTTRQSPAKPGAYSNVPSWQSMMLNEPLPEDCLGWVAHYNPTTSPNIPVGWTRPKTRMHQVGIAGVYDWCPPVPGMRSVVDVNRWYGTLAELRALGSDVIPPPPEEPPMSELTDKVAQAQGLLDQLDTVMADIAVLAEEQPDPPPPPPVDPPPPPVSTDITIRTTDSPRTNARFNTGNNAAGFPTFEIYPGDSRPTSERIQWPVGTFLKAKPATVHGDSGVVCFELTERKGRAGETLYVRTQDAARV